MKSSILIFLVFILSIGGIHAQKTKIIDLPYQSVVSPSEVPAGFVQIQASAFKLVKMNVSTLLNQLQGITYREGALDGFVGELTLPYPDGSNHSFTIKRNQTLHPDLNVKFPETITLDGYALDGSGAFAKWDITPQGFHAMIMIPGKSTVFIDPYLKGNTEYYIVYEKDAFITDKQKDCGVVSASKGQPGPTVKLAFGTCELRTYRLALSATGEYTAFHGGTVALAQAAQATSMNRVNGVYEKDIAITMVIVPNNNLIVYTSTTADPFANGTPGTMINQNQTTCDGQIGSANYDIGHVFGTNSGGLAGLGVVCTGGQKARGVTGSSAPIGDPFDIDYVAHEMGHQFGGNHTQNNNCNSVGAARREPGSASTIMGYAGICAPNVQNNSDDYFHGYNLGEISAEILSGGHTCEVITALNNSAPTITSAGGNITVPINTPFVLTGVATDANGDVLTYLWEQMDNEASTQPPVATATGGPNFRSFDPSTNPSRYFPNLASLAANGPYTWEVLPSVSRVMDFRLTVKDNHAVGACNAYADVTVTTVAAAGPFVVTYPTNTGITWGSGSTQTVTWNVANTTAAPISCANVKILLSLDGGVTYPIVLSASTPNDGSQAITVPNASTTTARVMVMSIAGTFFDISNNNFAITCLTPATPAFTAVSALCQNSTAPILSTTSNNGITGSWSAPISTSTAGTSTYTFTPTTGLCASNATMTITVNSSTTPTFTQISPLCQNTMAPTLSTTSNNGITGTWSSPINTGTAGTSTYTFTPSAGTCASTATMTITVNNSVIPTFTQVSALCQNTTAPTLSTTSNNGITGTWSAPISTSAAGTSTYTFTPSAGSCASTTTMTITVNSSSTPTFTQISPLCQNTTAPTLSTTSNNGITGSWSAPISTSAPGTSNYTFTPSAGSCASNATMTITVNSSATPTFTQISPLCQNTSAPTLSTTSTNGITGTWSSPINTSTAGTSTYTFTPSAGTCASTATMTITVNNSVTPTFTQVSPLCQNTAAPTLSTTSNNGITGTWSSPISTSTLGTTTYTFTPTSGQCATNATMSVSVTNPDVPVLSAIQPNCYGDEAILTIASGNLNGAQQWEWFSGSCNGPSIGVGTSITVNTLTNASYFAIANGNGCTSANCAQIDVFVPGVINTNVNQNGATLTAAATGVTYQWIDCGNGNSAISGATSQTYTPTLLTGSYAVVVTNGACSDTSICVLVDQNGIDDLIGIVFDVIPNPVDDQMTLLWSTSDMQDMELLDAAGRLVFTKNITGKNELNVNMEALRSGVYFVRMIGQSGTAVRQIVKQ
jgi:hypothetical protein